MTSELIQENAKVPGATLAGKPAMSVLFYRAINSFS